MWEMESINFRVFYFESLKLNVDFFSILSQNDQKWQRKFRSVQITPFALEDLLDEIY